MNEYIIRCAYCGKSMKANDPCIGEKVSCEDCVLGITKSKFTEELNDFKIMKTIEDKVIEYLDSIIVMDDNGCQWLSVEFNEMEEKIRKLFKDHEK